MQLRLESNPRDLLGIMLKMQIPMKLVWVGPDSACLTGSWVVPLLLVLVSKSPQVDYSVQLGSTPQIQSIDPNLIFPPGPRVSQCIVRSSAFELPKDLFKMQIYGTFSKSELSP